MSIKLFRFILRPVSVTLMLLLLCQIVFPLGVYALTGGPSQPEVESFEPIGTSEMVDLFSGDFNYNVPLLDVGGYPINIAYHSGVSMDQEAGMCGLGWNINPGVITRNMRGLPDDFNGTDKITKRLNIKPNRTHGLLSKLDLEFFSSEDARMRAMAKGHGGSRSGIGTPKRFSPSLTLGVKHNNYRGIGWDVGIGAGVGIGKREGGKTPANASIGLTSSTFDGLNVNIQASFPGILNKKAEETKGITRKMGFGLSLSSRTGLNSLSFFSTKQKTQTYLKRSGDFRKDVVNPDYGQIHSKASYGHAINFGYTSYTPITDNNYSNFSTQAGVSFGLESNYIHYGLEFTYYYSVNKLKNNNTNVELPAVGYMYAEKSFDYGNVALDMNREQDVTMTPNSPYVPISVHTHDTYDAVGHGVGGSFKPCRGDLGVLHPNKTSSHSISSLSIAPIELSFGNLIKIGPNVGVSGSYHSTGRWGEGSNFFKSIDPINFFGLGAENEFLNKSAFTGRSNAFHLYEPFYFKEVGELTANDDDWDFYHDYLGGDRPKTPRLTGQRTLGVELDPEDPNNPTTNNQFIRRSKRDKRNQVFSFLTAEEAQKFALDKNIKVRYVNSKEPLLEYLLQRTDGPRKGHHISEITVLKPDGSRYVYGLPAYVTKQVELTFNVNGGKTPVKNIIKPQDYLCNDCDVKKENGDKLGAYDINHYHNQDQYFSSEEVPGYAYAYHLTAVLSPDYVDLTNDGVSDDDLGSAVKIHYTKWSNELFKEENKTLNGIKNMGGVDLYPFRTPFRGASFSEGIKDDGLSHQNRDNKAHIVYGEKEIFYVHSIETKSHISFFNYGTRFDTYSISTKDPTRAQNEGGYYQWEGINSPQNQIEGKDIGSFSLFKLNRIELFHKTPNGQYSDENHIKSVHFEYDYSLCKNVWNNYNSYSPVYTTFNNTSRHYFPRNFEAVLSGRDIENPYRSDQSGKLTLRKIFFTYKGIHQEDAPIKELLRQAKGRLTAYEFKYFGDDVGEESLNPDYDISAYDRWGEYKPNNDNKPNHEIPYADQYRGQLSQETEADHRSKVWHLKEVFLPSGGKIRVELESDDYAYVQDKPAMEMTPIIGSCRVNELNSVMPGEVLDVSKINDKLYEDNNDYKEDKDHSRLIYFFKLREPVTGNNGTEAREQFKNSYLRDIKIGDFQSWDNLLQYRFNVAINQDVNRNYIEGSVGIETYGVAKMSNNGSYDVGYIQLKSDDGPSMNPICRNAWNFARLYAPAMVFENYNTNDQSELEAIGMGLLRAFAGLVTQFPTLFESPNRGFRRNGVAQKFVPEKSFFRLMSPGGAKKGGGVRVKRLILDDNWSNMISSETNKTTPNKYENAVYGQDYIYRTHDNATHRMISSGVAGYEPIIGSEENPWRRIKMYKEERFLRPDDIFSMYEPMGETYFPAPSVGYSKVIVIPVSTHHYTPGGDHEKPNPQSQNIGFTVHEFYTGRDFPIYTEQTKRYMESTSGEWTRDVVGAVASLAPFAEVTGPLLDILGVTNVDRLGLSMGYTVNLNNMHGKPKSQKDYREPWKEGYLSNSNNIEEFKNLVPYNGVEYTYKTDAQNGGRLATTTDVIGKDLNIKHSSVGLDIEPTLDMRSSDTENWDISAEFNIDIDATTGIPTFFAMLFPAMNKESTTYRAASMMKVVRRSGILSTVTKWSEGAVTVSENLLWDSETGEVVLTRTQNEYNDHVYSFTYPAHWVYDRMGQAYKNIGVELVSNTKYDLKLDNGYLKILKGVTIDSEIQSSFVAGDEIGIWTKNGGYLLLTVVNINQGQGVCVVDTKGEKPLDTSIDKLKILRSGRRNQQMTPVGVVVTLDDPRINNKIDFTGKRILNASATEFGEQWQASCCGTGDDCIKPNQEVNAYRMGILGNWRPTRSFSYLSERAENPLSNVRYGGIFRQYHDFWKLNNDGKLERNFDPTESERWISPSHTTLMDQYGNQLESKDALGNYSSALYGYKNSLPVAVATNARYNEIMYEGFEDNNVVKQGGCVLRKHSPFVNLHLSDSPDHSNVNKPEVAHSGRYSAKIKNGTDPNEFLTLERRVVFPCSTEGGQPQSDCIGYQIDSCRDCLPIFAPFTSPINKPTHVISAWIKGCPKDNNGLPRLDYSGKIVIKLYHQNNEPTNQDCNLEEIGIAPIFSLSNGNPIPSEEKITPSGNIIDGWQKIEAAFNIPASVTNGMTTKSVHAIKVFFEPESLSCSEPAESFTYYDDVRIHPIDANVKSFVYDSKDLRYVASLDENNYATFYEYETDGSLVRVKRETEKGIMTVNETRKKLFYKKK